MIDQAAGRKLVMLWTSDECNINHLGIRVYASYVLIGYHSLDNLLNSSMDIRAWLYRENRLKFLNIKPGASVDQLYFTESFHMAHGSCMLAYKFQKRRVRDDCYM